MNDGSGTVKITAISTSGDINDALSKAIAEAKKKLVTDFVRWDLLHLSGENGGISGRNDLNITITAKGPE